MEMNDDSDTYNDGNLGPADDGQSSSSFDQRSTDPAGDRIIDHEKHEKLDAKSELGMAIQRWRIRRGLSVEALGERAGLLGHHVLMIERGECDPAFSTVAAIAAGLGLSAGEMLSGDHEAIADSALEIVRLYADAPEPVKSSLPTFLMACIAANEAKAKRRARRKPSGS